MSLTFMNEDNGFYVNHQRGLQISVVENIIKQSECVYLFCKSIPITFQYCSEWINNLANCKIFHYFFMR